MKTKKIKEKFEQLVFVAGYNSLNSFANSTQSISGKKRSLNSLKNHFLKAPKNLDILRGYANDLGVDIYEMMQVFEVEIENDFNFPNFLKINGFNNFDDCEMIPLKSNLMKIASSLGFNSISSYMYFNQDLLILIRASSTVGIDLKLEQLKFFVPYQIDSIKEAKRLVL